VQYHIVIDVLAHSAPVAFLNLPHIWVDTLVIMFEDGMNIGRMFDF